MARLTEIIKRILPPPNWRLPVLILTGAFSGLTIYALVVSNAISYMSDSPETCVNCHVMAPQYATWFHSSHREHATCNDCHVPQTNVVEHYYFKAKDGLRHATIFTLRTEPDVIIMHEPGRRVVQANCQRCHDDLNHQVVAGHTSFDEAKQGQGPVCWDCHRDVPHGTVRSAGSVPDGFVPLPDSPMPEWLRNLTNPH
ncbi:MAG: nitrate reductase tetraheme cytochrome c subunit NrfH [Bacteroidetes bacterium HLUCCA01]|nr:MAG: nitrate reductase tetraheme cytochrome c subunit NrfH [Bacteroidetes bacterium HLUCCA01]